MARVHDERNLRFAGLAVIAVAFLTGAIAGGLVEVEVCGARPPVARIGMTIGAAVIVALEVGVSG
jgi:hypothetical protein